MGWQQHSVCISLTMPPFSVFRLRVAPRASKATKLDADGQCHLQAGCQLRSQSSLGCGVSLGKASLPVRAGCQFSATSLGVCVKDKIVCPMGEYSRHSSRQNLFLARDTIFKGWHWEALKMKL